MKPTQFKVNKITDITVDSVRPLILSLQIETVISFCYILGSLERGSVCPPVVLVQPSNRPLHTSNSEMHKFDS